MKIAVHFFGIPRTFEACSIWFNRHFLSPIVEKGNNVDLFGHLWGGQDFSSWHKAGAAGISDKDKLADMLENAYGKFKGLEIELQENDENLGAFEGSYGTVQRIAVNNMLLSMEKSNALRCDEGYDFVIFVRPDIFFKSSFDLFYQIAEVDSETLFFAGWNNMAPGLVDEENLPNIRGNDLLFGGTPQVINQIMNSRREIMNMIPAGSKHSCAHESFLIKKAMEQGFTPRVIDFFIGRDFALLRSDGSHFVG